MASIVTVTVGKPRIVASPSDAPGKEFLVYIGDATVTMGREELVLFAADAMDVVQARSYESVEVKP